MIYKTKDGQIEVELKDYISGREFKQIQSLFMSGATMQEGYALKANDPKVFLEVQDKMIDLVVVAIGGVRENVRELAEDLRQSDYQELVEKVSVIVNGMDEEKKTK